MGNMINLDDCYPKTPNASALRLAPTSALVLRWTPSDVYASPEATAFLSMLDLTEGKALQNACEAVWPPYGKAIELRKRAISRLSEEALRRTGATQFASIAAGLAPLSIEIAARVPDILCFDVDLSNMNEKSMLTANAAPLLSPRLRHVTADVSDAPALRDALASAGWDFSAPGVIVFEGITYYINENALAGALRLFRPTLGGSVAIVEHLVPPEALSNARRHIPELVFGEVVKACGLAGVTRMTADSIAAMAGTPPPEVVSLSDTERRHFGRACFFPDRASGWLEIAILHIHQ